MFLKLKKKSKRTLQINMEIVQPFGIKDDEIDTNPLHALTPEYKAKCQSFESEATRGVSPLIGLMDKLKTDRQFQSKLASSVGNIIAFKFALYTGRQSRIAKELIKQQFVFIDQVCAYGKVTGDIYYKDPIDGNIKRYSLFELEDRYKTMVKVWKDQQERMLQENIYQADDEGGRVSGESQNYGTKDPEIELVREMKSMSDELETIIDKLHLDPRIWIAKPWKNMVTNENGQGMEITDLVKFGQPILNNTLLSMWKRHVDQMQEIISLYEREIKERSRLSEQLSNVEPKDSRWRDLFTYDAQCNSFSKLYQDYNAHPDESDLRQNFPAFYEALDEYNAVKEIISRIQSIMTTYGITCVVKKKNDAGQFYIVPQLGYDEGELKHNTQVVVAAIGNIQRIIDFRLKATADINPDSLFNRIQIFNSAIKGYSRQNVKQTVVGMINAFANNWSQFVTGYVNWYLVGPAGSGKTTIAQSIGPVLASIGILIFGDFYTESRASLVGQYVGETAIKTRSKLIKSLESVMFIDEAYAIAKAGSGTSKYDQFGLECIDEIVGFLDKQQGQICVIVAGYECMMQQYFLKANEGLTRRFPTKYSVTLERLCPIELWEIFRADILAKVTFKDTGATIDDVLSLDAQKIVTAVFYAGSDIPGKDATGGLVTFRHLFENEASDAVELSQEISTLYFANDAQLSAEIVGNLLIAWLKAREQKDVSYEMARDSQCDPVAEYDHVDTTIIQGTDFRNIKLQQQPIVKKSIAPSITGKRTGQQFEPQTTPAAGLPPVIETPISYNKTDNTWIITIPGQIPTIFNGKECIRDGLKLSKPELQEVCKIISSNIDPNQTVIKLNAALKPFFQK